MASEQDKAIEAKTSENVTAGIGKVQAAAKTPADAAKPATPPAPLMWLNLRVFCSNGFWQLGQWYSHCVCSFWIYGFNMVANAIGNYWIIVDDFRYQ